MKTEQDYKKMSIEKYCLNDDPLKLDLIQAMVDDNYCKWYDIFGYADVVAYPGYSREQLIQEYCELDPNHRQFDDMDEIADYVNDPQWHWIGKKGIVEISL